MDGKYFSCEKEIKYGWVCEDCKKKDYFFLCMKCDGKECINKKRRGECRNENYYIYLAAFDSLLKVGISHEFRFLERLVEQGADLGAKIAMVRDGKEVRKIEQKIKDYLQIVDRVNGKQKHRYMFGNPNVAANNIFNAISKLRSNGFSLINPEIYDLRGYYKLSNVLVNPIHLDIKEGEELNGKIIAAKGNILVFRDENRFFSINAHDIIGREIELLSQRIDIPSK